MEELIIKGKEIPLVKAALELEENILKFSLQKYRAQVTQFEKNHHFSTKTFLQNFNSGELGDKSEWFDWLFAYKAVEHVKEKLSSLKEIKL